MSKVERSECPICFIVHTDTCPAMYPLAPTFPTPDTEKYDIKYEVKCMCKCDGLCMLDKDELLAILMVRLRKLDLNELAAFNQFLVKLRSNRNTEDAKLITHTT